MDLYAPVVQRGQGVQFCSRIACNYLDESPVVSDESSQIAVAP